jgi:endonuclease/exonuclease/phosphatase (EEP) superfamily protein YafD
MPRLKTIPRALLVAIVFGFSFATLVSGFGQLHWTAELITHFRLQAAISGSLILLSCALFRMRFGAVVTAVSIAFHVYPMLPVLLPSDSASLANASQLRVMQLNVHTSNRNHQAVIKTILDENPDIVGLIEVNQRWLSALAPLHHRYPYRIEDPREDNFGIALFSRLPIENLRLRPLDGETVQMISGEFFLGQVPVTVAVAHLLPPMGPRYSARRNRQFLRMAELLRQPDDREIILLGDLNSSPWSPFFRGLELSAGINNGAQGFGLQLTWPVSMPLLRIPIDHCLLSSGLRATGFKVGPPVGSDHLPILVEIATVQATAVDVAGHR